MIVHVILLVSGALRKAVNDRSGEMTAHFKTIAAQENVISSKTSDQLSLAGNIK